MDILQKLTCDDSTALEADLNAIAASLKAGMSTYALSTYGRKAKELHMEIIELIKNEDYEAAIPKYEEFAQWYKQAIRVLIHLTDSTEALRLLTYVDEDNSYFVPQVTTEMKANAKVAAKRKSSKKK